MTTFFKNLLKSILENNFLWIYFFGRYYFSERPYFLSAFSQEGEDILINKIFLGFKKGFYIDIGAHHPIKWSTTYLLYKKGWRGMNIDPVPGMKPIFDKFRSEDINLQIGVSKKAEVIKYYNFKEKAYNTFSEELGLLYQKVTNLESIILVETKPLSEIIEDNIPSLTSIDYLSIDVEGLELEVLLSLSWDKFRPKVIMVEILDLDLRDAFSNEVVIFLVKKGYKLFSKLFHSIIFLHEDFEPGQSPAYISSRNIKKN